MPIHLFKRKGQCCGCEACANVCPKGIIAMIADEEGFYYPQIMEPENCINCEKCLSVCPIKNAKKVVDFHERAVAGYFEEMREVKKSASGGLATAISRGFVKTMGGGVYGVTYTKDFLMIEYRKAISYIEIEKFRTSKYAQSRKQDVYTRIKADLIKGENVLFIGLPCDAYALKLFLGREYRQLYICTLICHGVTSPLVHKQYILSLIEDQENKIVEFTTRYKKEGWKPYYIRARFQKGNEYLEKFNTSRYGIAFLYLKRPSCNSCPIKREFIHSDITMGDYHLAAGGAVRPYNPNGVSSAVVHTEKGERLLELAEDFYVKDIPLKNVMYSEAYSKAIPVYKNRREFGETLSREGLDAACSLSSIERIERANQAKTKFKEIGARIKKIILRKKNG